MAPLFNEGKKRMTSTIRQHRNDDDEEKEEEEEDDYIFK